jgi:sugar transferase (PEP-CTERM/EpsH1 system associated)
MSAEIPIVDEKMRPLQPRPPLVVHLVYRFAVGGLENGLVNLINGMPAERYRHAIISLTEYTDFRFRIGREDVPVFALHKREGQDWVSHGRLWRMLRALRPAIVHTRNLPTLEYLVPAMLAGVRGRIHGEHGRDMYDLYGASRKYNLLRRGLRPVVQHYITVSADLAGWLVQTVGARVERVQHIYNGVDTQRFHPRTQMTTTTQSFGQDTLVTIGTVGRMQTVKDPLTLVRAFLHVLATQPAMAKRLRLMLIGDGPLRAEAQRMLRAADAERFAWLPGERSDIPELMRALDIFVLPSLGEGISNTILEAMASGLPVIATHVGGNPELVEDGQTGRLVPPSEPVALAGAIVEYLVDAEFRVRHGRAGRVKVETYFSLDAMIHSYLAAYDAVLESTHP